MTQKKIIQLPKRSNNFEITIGEQKVVLNFGLKFACEIDSYLADEAAAQGVDNLALIATRLAMRSPATLMQVMVFSLLGTTVTEDALVKYVEDIADSSPEKYEGLFDYFFTNLLASPSLSLKARKAMPVIDQMTRMMKSQEEALLLGLTEMTGEMEIQLAAARAMLEDRSAEEDAQS